MSWRGAMKVGVSQDLGVLTIASLGVQFMAELLVQLGSWSARCNHYMAMCFPIYHDVPRVDFLVVARTATF